MKTAILGSFVLSIWHSILFWNKNWGVSMSLFFIPITLFLVYVLNKSKKVKDKKACTLIIPIILLSFTYMLFDNKSFAVINIIAILGLIAIMSIWLTAGDLKLKLLISKIFSVLFGPIELFGESGKKIKDLFQTEQNNGKILKKIVKTILITIPIALIVLYLLMSADTIFADSFGWIASYLKSLFVDYEIIYFLLRIVIIFILGIYFLSYIINLIGEHTSYSVSEEVNKRKEHKIDIFTINTVLTILNIIYFIFSIIQFVYLFIGIEKGANFDYAQYARQGFFQLLFVSFINFILLFICNGCTKNLNKYTKWMNVLMAIFTGVIIVSSFFRMHLYQQEYGYTYLRLAVDFILLTEMVLLVPIIIYITKKKIHLVKVCFTIILTMYIIANYANFDYLIAKKNIDNYFKNEQENEIDLAYLKYNTGFDAMDEITRLLKTNNNQVKEAARTYLIKQKKVLESQESTWQEYNYSKERARKILSNIENETI